MISYPEGSFSKLNTITDGFRVLKTILWVFKDYKPLTFFSVISLLFFDIIIYFSELSDYVNNKKDIPLFIGGKSMGSRAAASLLSKEQGFDFEHASSINGVFCLGYPFHPAKKPEKLRLAPLQLATKPVLIVQGERDTLGSKAEIDEYSLSDLCQCVFLEDGDHSLKPRVKSGFTYQQHLSKAAEQISLFIDKHL